MSIRSIALSICVVLVAACGGGGGGSGPAGIPVMQLAPSLDGFVDNMGLGISLPLVRTDSVGRVGSGGFCTLRLPPSCQETRLFFVFDRSSLPPGAVITGATLRVYQEGVEDSPYTTHGNLVVDHVDVDGTLTTDDFDGGTLTSDLGTLSTTADLEYKVMDVTGAVVADGAAGRTSSAFRLRFRKGGDGTRGRATLTTVEDLAGTGNPPVLEVTYTLP